jgi:hypothetical protein
MEYPAQASLRFLSASLAGNCPQDTAIPKKFEINIMKMPAFCQSEF